ncbi:hypothetical protein [Candidatus Odyssella acanthamoebae]|uniref:Uncharacterized protein n=1 Tax=Candidatus Odyssella acanthamoebae TaxID=91604 RepID=A0A077AT74_9PROT|nr:hypothetical protein [Candidatus Paracaedibacter acanthamoebae]AIK95576.1 hypothetical protein ID47_00590 [Candidatus Paracaedibacter acanthamoebae]
MRKILLSLLIMASHLPSKAYECTNKVLESEANAYVSKIWSKVSLQEEQIKESLTFLHKSPSSQNKYEEYLDTKRFKDLYEDIKGMQKPELEDFAKSCRKIYKKEESINRIAVFMLLQKIADKYNLILEKNKSLKPSKKHEDKGHKLSSNKLLELFLNADKNINVH